MSRVDELLAELAPNGVDYRALGDFAQLVRGSGMPKSELTDEGVGAIHYGHIYTSYGAWATQTRSFVSHENAARLAKVEPGDIVITNTSENLEDVAKAVAWLGPEPVVTGGHATVVKHDQDPRYLAYWFQSPFFATQKRALATGTKVIDVSARQLSGVRVPVPPREVQREIVRILDHFTELELELEAELEARKKQYEVLRDQLVHAVDRAPWAALGDVATVVRGASPRPIEAFLTDDPYAIPWIKIGDVPAGGKFITSTAQRITEVGAKRSRLVAPGDFILSNSMSFGRPYISRIRGCIHDGWLAISDFSDQFLPDFLYHLLRSSAVQSEFARSAGSSTVSNLNSAIVRAIRLPVPPLAEQRRIADILDTFDTLVNDLSVGLPAELAARRKQYEYYRDKLLTFQEAS